MGCGLIVLDFWTESVNSKEDCKTHTIRWFARLEVPPYNGQALLVVGISDLTFVKGQENSGVCFFCSLEVFTSAGQVIDLLQRKKQKAD